MNQKIKSFLVASISTKAIALAVCPLRAAAQRDGHSQKQFCILE